MAAPTPQELIKEYDREKGDRGTTESHWQQLTELIMPDRGDFLSQRTPGSKLLRKVFNGYAIWANEVLAAGCEALISSSSLRFFDLTTHDEKINRDRDAQLWLNDTAERVYRSFADPLSGWATSSNELYLDLGAIGSATMSILDDPDTDVNFATRHMSQVVWLLNDKGEVDGLAYRFKYTAEQAVVRWGGKAGAKVIEAFAAGDQAREFEFQHSVKRRIERDAQRIDRRNKAYASYWLSLTALAVVDEGGFDEFPYICPRGARKPGETYGRGRGMTALADCLELQEREKTTTKAAQKVVDPPLQVPDEGFVSTIRTLPGGLNFYRSGTTDRIDPIKTGGDVQLGIELIERMEQRIGRIFFVDLLTMLVNPDDPSGAGKGVTATWVQHWRDMAMQRMNPFLGRMRVEGVGRAIPRVAKILARRGRLLPIPEIMQREKLRIEYVSPLELAQRAAETANIDRWLTHLGGLAQFDPAAAQLADVEALSRLYARRLNVPAIGIRSEEDMALRRRMLLARQQQEDTAQNAAAVAGIAQQGAGAVKDLAAAQTQGAA